MNEVMKMGSHDGISAFIRDPRDFPSGPGVKNLPSNAGGGGSIPGRGSHMPQGNQVPAPQLESPHAVTTEFVGCGAHMLHNRKTLHTATRSPCAATKTQCRKKKKFIYF